MHRHHSSCRLWSACSDDVVGPQPVAHVACRQLGFTSGQMLGPPGSGTGGVPPPGRVFWVDKLDCGTQANDSRDWLAQCTFSGWGPHACDRDTAALALICGEGAGEPQAVDAWPRVLLVISRLGACTYGCKFGVCAGFCRQAVSLV
jgi:hypothetical protein